MYKIKHLRKLLFLIRIFIFNPSLHGRRKIMIIYTVYTESTKNGTRFKRCWALLKQRSGKYFLSTPSWGSGTQSLKWMLPVLIISLDSRRRPSKNWLKNGKNGFFRHYTKIKNYYYYFFCCTLEVSRRFKLYAA